MLVKGGDDVALGNDDEILEEVQEKKAEIIEQKTTTKENETEATQAKPTTYKKIIKKTRRPSVMPKLAPESEKKVEMSNKQQMDKPKVTKTVDVKKQVKKVTVEKVKRSIPVVNTKDEEQNKEETEDVKLQSIDEQEWELDNDSCHSSSSEDEIPIDKDAAERTEEEKAEDELNAILAPLRAQVPNNFRISPTMGFLPIMPVTFSWFPMSQQHKEEFQKMRNQSKFPNSLRPFQRFAAT